MFFVAEPRRHSAGDWRSSTKTLQARAIRPPWQSPAPPGGGPLWPSTRRRRLRAARTVPVGRMSAIPLLRRPSSDRERPVYVDGRPVSANTGRSPTAQRTHQSDPLLSFEIGPMNGRKARESGLRPKASVARGATVPETSCKCVGSTRGRSPTCPTLNRCRRKGAAWAHLRADDDRHFSLPRAMLSWPSEGLPSKAVPSEKSRADLRSVPRWCNLPTLSSEAER